MNSISSVKLLISSLLLVVLLMYCEKEKQVEEKILVKIGSKSISVDEFTRRAEYIVRPPYCDSNTDIHKKIVLNSLIAEKLMAIDAGQDNSFLNSVRVKSQLEGRKEQAMRLVQFFHKAYDQALIDSMDIKKYFLNAGREYKVAYFNVSDSVTARNTQVGLFEEKMTFKKAFQQLGLFTDPPKREINWTTFEHDAILESLYGRTLEKDQIVGPIIIDENQFMFFKVLDWTNEALITEKDHDDRLQLVTDRLRKKNARLIYDQYIYSVMKGKSIEFNPDTFRRLTDILGPYYFKSGAQKQELANKNIIGLKDQQSGEDLDEGYPQFHTDMEEIANSPLFEVDGIIWTVQKLVDEFSKHPLVFRKKRMEQKDFGKELQMAIIDMVRDKHLTAKAYDDGYDKLPGVIREHQMWQDHLNYQYYKANYLKSLHIDSSLAQNQLKVIDLYLNPLVDSLQAKYSEMVKINMEEFNQIKLTRIQMSVIQQNVPYAKPVPGFPIITTDFRLSYGKIMNKTGKLSN